MGKRHVSLKDLATEMGVSISTVSRALKNHPDISPKLTTKIQRLAKEKNYSPNPLAMGLLRQQTKMIGVIVPDIVTHFYSSIISGIEEVAKQKGYFIVIASSNESLKKEIESVQNLLKARVEGLIVCISKETNSFGHFEKLVDNEIPLVFFDRIGAGMDVPTVVADGIEAAAKITRHFYENECRRIAYISGPDHLNISRSRKEGYLKGLKECGLDFDSQLLEECDLSTQGATRATQNLLRLSKRPDAIFGLNDTIAFAAMKEIKKQGMTIPNDIAMVGFTDEFHSTVVEPALTSITHPTLQMGKEAATLFFDQIENGIQSKKQIVLATDLVIRNSSVRS
jgi:LacI family transcriptional regulator